MLKVPSPKLAEGVRCHNQTETHISTAVVWNWNPSEPSVSGERFQRAMERDDALAERVKEAH